MNEHVVINSDKTMEIPEWLKDWLVQFDHKTTTITFDCPRYWRGIDLLEYAIYVSVIKKGKEPHTDLCENVCADENNSEMIHFDWKPTKAALSEKGELSFLICARITEDETIEGAWHTKICRMIKVAEGHECQIIDEEQYEDIITELVLQMKAISEQLANGGGGETPNAVQYVPQELTEEQQEVARGNIGAASAVELGKVQEEIVYLGGSIVEPKTDDIPKIFFDEAIPQTKDDVVTKFRYISKTLDFEGYAEFKAQGNSSMNYAKKNVTVKMYKDETLTEKLKVDFKGWGKQRKHVYKANWIDLSHVRNVVSARIWAEVVKSRSNYLELPELFRKSPNQGAVDGFPIKVYSQGVYQGRYTLNIPKDAWMANMDDELDNHCILCSENYASGCFRTSANINESDWTDEIHDTVPTSIKTRWNEVISFVMNSTDEEFKTNLGNYFFVDSLIDYLIFGMVSCGLDAFGKNQLFFTYDGIKWIAGMYDMDSTWGLYWNGSKFVSASYSRTEYEDFVSNRQGNLLYIRLVELFGTEIKARYEELKHGVLSVPNIINHFERFTDIAPLDLVKEDYASTTGSGKFTGIPSKDTNNIQQIRKFVVDRYAYCDEYFASLGEVEPEEPDDSEITLSSISATYNGGNVTVGTELSALTGIIVTATYSDGSTANVTDYELSGSIVEGENTIAVSYGGKTTTFIVIAIIPITTFDLREDGSRALSNPITFDGVDDYFDTGYKLLDEDRDFTLMFEYEMISVNQGVQKVVVQCAREESPYPGIIYRNAHNATDGMGYALSTYATADKHDVSYATLGTDNTNRVVITHEKGSNKFKLQSIYNSFEMGLGTKFTEMTPIEETVLLGAYCTTSGVYGRFWNGTIHQLIIHERVLTDTEISAFINA